MQQDGRHLFDKIEKKTNVKKEDIFQIADSLKNANLKDEQTIRQLVRRLSAMANVPVSKEKEDAIVNAVVKQNMPLDFGSLNNMFKK